MLAQGQSYLVDYRLGYRRRNHLWHNTRVATKLEGVGYASFYSLYKNPKQSRSEQISRRKVDLQGLPILGAMGAYYSYVTIGPE